MKAEIEVLQPGLFSSIQDTGRSGFMKYGVPVSGVMDSFASRTANLILQNPENAAILEITQLGPKLRFTASTQIAISGAFLSPKINGRAIENNKTYKIEEGEVLSFGRRIDGCRAYLAVKGGFRTDSVLNSKSWYEGLTRYTKLEKGMKLPFETFQEEYSAMHAVIKSGDYIISNIVEVYPGPEFGRLSEEKRKSLIEATFSIGRHNNRMGIQLQENIENSLDPILTGPVLPGTVQLTPSGKLIVLMKDGQTTGGYPRVLQLSIKGMNTLAQKVMGDILKFQLI